MLKQIKQYPAYYADSLGYIWSTKACRFLTNCLDSYGYPQVHMTGNRSTLVHHLITSTFIGPRPRGKQVNHINGNKTDNRLENLEYVTPSQNMKHAVSRGLRPSFKGVKNGSAKLTEKDVLEIRGVYAKEFLRITAKRFGVTTSQIWDIRNRNSWKHI